MPFILCRHACRLPCSSLVRHQVKKSLVRHSLLLICLINCKIFLIHKDCPARLEKGHADFETLELKGKQLAAGY
jgi:hypothetical protein